MEEEGEEPMQLDVHDPNANDDNANGNPNPIVLGGGEGQPLFVFTPPPPLPPATTPTAPNAPNNQDDFVVENPTLDLESYASGYAGVAKVLRLIHVADHCPGLKADALKLAIAHVQTKTLNVEMYQQLHKKARGNAQPSVAGGGAGAPDVASTNGGAAVGGADSGSFPPVDNTWVEATAKRVAITLDKLDTDLKNYKSNSIKESIRRGYDDLGEFYVETGDLLNALKSFTRSRDYCTSAKHVINMCLNIIKVSIYLQNWAHVSNYVLKAENTPDPSDEKKVNGKEVAATTAKLRAAAGLAELAGKKYRAAGRLFLQVSFEAFDAPEMLSQGNIATYAALCALASFNRKELQELVISSSSFKPFLELEPPIRDVIYSFHESKYAKCLQLLDEMRGNLLLDLYLAPHVGALYSSIRSRALIQYFAPYASADMAKMATSFNTSVNALENELIGLILGGQIEGRIDSQNKVLYVKREDERGSIFKKALLLGEEYERKTRLMILRTAMLKAHLQVKNPSKDDTSSQEHKGGRRDRSNNFNNHF